MMIKQKFDLLKGVDNVIKVSASTISKVLVANGPRKIFVNLELERQIGTTLDNGGVFSIEIIGNIHENPELLERGTDGEG